MMIEENFFYLPSDSNQFIWAIILNTRITLIFVTEI